jgi:nicotinamide-nucleotide amidase
MTPAELIDLARAEGHVLAAAESCTGGLLGATLTEVPGSSDVFDRSYVTYSNAAKREMVGVSAATLTAHGAVSEEVAREMAEGALALSRATIAVSITGIAGPGGSDHKPEGRVCFGLAIKGGCRTETVEFGAIGRDKVRRASVARALALIETSIRQDAHQDRAIRLQNAQNFGV